MPLQALRRTLETRLANAHRTLAQRQQAVLEAEARLKAARIMAGQAAGVIEGLTQALADLGTHETTGRAG